MKNKKKSISFSIGVAALCSLIAIGSVTPANAVPVGKKTAEVSAPLGDLELESAEGPSQVSGAVSSPTCVAELTNEANEQDADPAEYLPFCDTQVELEISEVESVSPAEAQRIARSGELAGSEAQSFVAAAAARPIHSVTWTATGTGIAYTFKEVMKGKAYFDGERSWVANYRGNTGWFRCHEPGSYAVGVVVTPLSCTKGRTAANGVWHRSKVDISVAIKGGPIAFTHQLEAVADRNGKVTTSSK